MSVDLTKDSVDLGIVVKDKEASLHFYRDTLGFKFVTESDMGNGMLMQRLMCGTSMIKLVTFAQTPELANPGGGINGATGYRYWTISVANLETIVAGSKIPMAIGSSCYSGQMEQSKDRTPNRAATFSSRSTTNERLRTEWPRPQVSHVDRWNEWALGPIPGGFTNSSVDSASLWPSELDSLRLYHQRSSGNRRI